MRLFIAVELPRGMKNELSTVLSELKQRSCGGRFVPIDNMHITLHFIGESADLAGAASAMHDACRDIRPFDLHLDKYSFFERGSSGKTSIVDVKGNLRELGILRESLESALADRGFSREFKRFKPHITLGRNVEHDELVTEELRSITLNSSTRVNSLTLFESRRINGQMVYTPLHVEKF